MYTKKVSDLYNNILEDFREYIKLKNINDIEFKHPFVIWVIETSNKQTEKVAYLATGIVDNEIMTDNEITLPYNELDIYELSYLLDIIMKNKFKKIN